MKKILKYIPLIAILVLATSDLKAQPPGGGPGGGGGPGPCFPPPCVPIDGGLSFLLIAGAAYGGKKVYEMNQKKEDQ